MVNQKRLVQTFLELVKIDSPSGEEQLMAKEVAKRLKALGAKVTFDSFGNVIGKIPGKGKPFILNAHLDTVEPGRGIKPIIDGGIIRSDNSTIVGADNKAGVSLILETLTSLKEERIKHSPLEVVFTLSEEVGLQGAINLNYSKISAKQGVTFDGHGSVANVTIAAPGYNRVDITITGRSAHAGVEPEKGISAIKIASEIISRLNLGRIDEETTANIGLIEGGSARNAVAEKAHFKGEIRSRNKDKLEKHTEHFQSVFDEIMANYGDAQIDIDISREFDPYHFDENHPVIQKLLGVFASLKIKPNLEPSGGGADVNIFNCKGIDIVDLGTGVHDMHTTRETLNLAEFFQAAQFAEKLVKVEDK